MGEPCPSCGVAYGERHKDTCSLARGFHGTLFSPKPLPSNTGEEVRDLDREEEQKCECGAAGSGEQHEPWCPVPCIPDDDSMCLRHMSRMNGPLCMAARSARKAASSSEDRGDIEAAQDALERLISTAKLLYQNAEGCAVNHHSFDFESQGLPGWLADCAAHIDRAKAALPLLSSISEDRDWWRHLHKQDTEILARDLTEAKADCDRLLAFKAMDEKEIERLREALVRAERKLTAYVGVCKGDKELTDTVLPMARAALTGGA